MDEQDKRNLFKILRENKQAIYIGSLRQETKKTFQQLALENFDNNYGAFLDFLFNFWLFNKDKLNFRLNDRIKELEERIEKIESR